MRMDQIHDDILLSELENVLDPVSVIVCAEEYILRLLTCERELFTIQEKLSVEGDGRSGFFCCLCYKWEVSMGELLWIMVWPVILYDSITVAVGVCWKDGQVLAIQAVSAFLSAGILWRGFLLYRRNGQIWGQIRNYKRHNQARRMMQGIFLGMTGCLFFNWIIELSGLKLLFPAYEQASKELFAPVLGLQILTMGVLIPVVEELIFRGFIYGALRRRYSWVVSMLGSAVVFGLYHGSLVQGLYAAVLTVVLAWSYEYSGSIRIPMVVHGMANMTAVLAERYHLYDGDRSVIIEILLPAACGVVMIRLLWNMRKETLKEGI